MLATWQKIVSLGNPYIWRQPFRCPGWPAAVSRRWSATSLHTGGQGKRFPAVSISQVRCFSSVCGSAMFKFVLLNASAWYVPRFLVGETLQYVLCCTVSRVRAFSDQLPYCIFSRYFIVLICTLIFVLPRTLVCTVNGACLGTLVTCHEGIKQASKHCLASGTKAQDCVSNLC